MTTNTTTMMNVKKESASTEADEVDHDEKEEEDDIDDRTRKQFVSSATTIQVDHGDDDHCDVTIQSTTSKTQSAPQPQRQRKFPIQPLDT